MYRIILITVIILSMNAVALLSAVKEISFDKPTDEELKLHKMINEYRTEKHLPSIRLSRSLTFVAKTHVKDMTGHPSSKPCNLHSWSKSERWTECCYTADHAKAKFMWNKPRELTNYQGNGFECAHEYSAGATARSALAGWKESPGHNAVIISKGMWASHPWKSIGVGIYGNYAVIWFGEDEDPDGYWGD